MTVRSSSGPRRLRVELVPRSATPQAMSRCASRAAFTHCMGLVTVSTAQAAELLDVSEETIRDRIADDVFPGVTMEGGAWRIPISSLRVLRPASSGGSQFDPEPPPYIQHLIERLEAFGTGTIPCADAARIAGIGIKAMRSGLRSGRIPGGRLVGGSWLVTVAEFGEWLGIRQVA
jgi:excisionase family DNA binding protein